MSLSASARARLSDQQAALVITLMDGGKPPADFDATRLRATALSLARKRARAAARAWPGLARSLGLRFNESFATYAAAQTLPRQGGPLADGRAFARWLNARKGLPEAGRIQALAVDLRYAGSPSGLVRRRWPTCKAGWFPQTRRLLVVVWLPWLGEHRLCIPFGRRRQNDEL